jgi:hypothetical protein
VFPVDDSAKVESSSVSPGILKKPRLFITSNGEFDHTSANHEDSSHPASSGNNLGQDEKASIGESPMGLFDKASAQNAPSDPPGESLSAAEAFASVAMVAIAADGYLSDQEAEDMNVMLSRMKLFSSYPNDVLHRMLDNLLSQLKQDGPNQLISRAKAALPDDLRETAFAVATDLVLSDRTVTQQEQAFLDDLYRILEIPDEIAFKIVQVMTIKNHG